MAIEALEEADPLSLPVTEVAPPEPESFVEAARLRAAVQEELAEILASSSFHTSKKSCEFLHYIVQVTLDGRLDSLKERSIGLDLLGRDVSYDPSSDATVRVRANEVRKRLRSYYSTQSSKSGYRIELLPGSYGPRFVPEPDSSKAPPPAALEIAAKPQDTRPLEPQLTVLPLNIVVIMRPALIALFICALFLRQQMQSGDPYHQFWDARLQGKNVMLILNGDTASGQATPQTPLPDQVAQALLPMIWLAGRYDLKPLMSSQKAEGDDKQTDLSNEAVVIHSSETTSPEFAADKRLRYLLAGQAGSAHLVDRASSKPDLPATQHAAVLTLFPDHPDVLWIAGTDGESINKLTEILSAKNNFPSQLTEETERGQVVQAVWRGDPSPRLEIYAHQP
ncbi:hypothetical protein [Granulicella mallensis]|uniref:Uncharacterized protein n=1 Tax=Granulicella mallensis (strain ATCC BAA-1857 / DSM 23137 / MP5ACTX8) TaxID=682795 RepID=G8NP80_GRAMM|nr:hypothetical protein [Granulicella mallensis]AEU38279.1 hypothetical protein AciX8_3996 [Granulicella mallensis MP5ACTX8]